MSGPTLGALFAGYGGLEMGLQAVLGGRVAWYSEIDPGASAILAHHYPKVPNLGDVTAVDWARVKKVDVLAGGFPCQDVSAAGKQAGLAPGTRSGLWTHFADAIEALKPSLVVIENVRGLTSAKATHPAHQQVEPCPGCVGGGDGPHLRALGAVLGDLADLGFDAEWTGVRASDVGAPHQRLRIFVTAWPAAAHARGQAARFRAGLREGIAARLGWGRPDHDGASGLGADGWAAVGAVAADALGLGWAAEGAVGPGPALAAVADAGAEPAADAEGDGRDEGGAEHARLLRGPDAPVRSAEAAADAGGRGVQRRGVAGELGGAPGAGAGEGLQRQRDLDAADHRGAEAAADAPGGGHAHLAHGGDPGGLALGAVAGAGAGDRAGDPAEGVRLLGGAAGELAAAAEAAADADGDRREGRPEPDLRAAGGQQAPHGLDADRRLRAAEGEGGRGGEAAADAERDGRAGRDPGGAGAPDARREGSRPEVEGRRPDAWGDYEPAVRRWEFLTRPAPSPTEPGAKGQPRLSPRFVEWLMGLPQGHVTDVPGLTRNAQLKALGNGVVPQQVAAALIELVLRMPVVAEAVAA